MNTLPPTANELRKFGLTIAAGLMLVCYLVLPVLFDAQRSVWPLPVALILALCAIIAPAGLGILYAPWMKIAHVLGRINTTIILSLVFVCLITPVGWMLRLARSGRRDGDSAVSTYKSLKHGRDSRHLEKPY